MRLLSDENSPIASDAAVALYLLHIILGLVVFCFNCVLGSSVITVIIPACRGDLQIPGRVNGRRTTKAEVMGSLAGCVLLFTVLPVVYAVMELTQFGLVLCCLVLVVACGGGFSWAAVMQLLEDRHTAPQSPPPTWIRPVSAPPQDTNHNNNYRTSTNGNNLETAIGMDTNDIELGASQSDEHLAKTIHDHLLVKCKARLLLNPPPTIPNESDIFLIHSDNSSSRRTVDEEYTCSICLSSFKDGEEVAWTRNSTCPHAFHVHCISEWCETAGAGTTCPICRRTMASESS